MGAGRVVLHQRAVGVQHQERLPARLERRGRRRHPADERRRAFAGDGTPRISLDAKTRESVGDVNDPGRRWRRKPTDASTHDVPTAAVAHAVPCGVFDPELNRGPVRAGTSGNTPEGAADAARDGWRQQGTRLHPAATALPIEADGGGSNGSRTRVTDKRLQAFAGETDRR